jgi:hypothetical protein
MGRVYRAFDHLTGRVVAVKQVRTPSDAEGLEREFAHLAGLRHPNLAEVSDYGADPRVGPYLVGDLYEGALDLVAAARALPFAARAELAGQLLRGLGWMHRQGVLHRDLKASNVLVVQGRVRIIDFGIAVHAAEAPVGTEGTHGYLAPELFRGERASVRSDLWSAGALVLELLTVDEPDARSPAPPRAERLARLTGPVALVIARMLAPVPVDRPATAEDALAEISAATGILEADEHAPVRHRLVGRDALLARLAAELYDATAGQTRARVIAGPAGIGKSRLLEELQSRALLAGIAVVSATARREADHPNAVWRPLAAWLALTSNPSESELRLLTTLGTAADAGLRDLGPEGARGRLFAGLLGGITRSGRALLLVIDDAQWLREDELAVLRLLAACVATSPVFLLVGWRESDPAALEAALPGVAALRLDPLPADDLRGLGTAAGVPPGDRLEALLPLVDGNPLLMIELAREARRPDALVGLEGGAIPVLEQLLSRRLATLPLECRRLVEIAAVAGRELDLPTLVHLLDRATLPRALETARRAGVLEWRDGIVLFAHDRLREVVLGGIAPADARALHGALARALEETGRAPHEPARVAWHLTCAGALVEAAVWSRRAGEAALAAGGLDEGIRLLVPTLPPERDHEAGAALLTRVGQACYALGRRADAERWLRRASAAGGAPCPTTAAGWVRATVALLGAGIAALATPASRRATADQDATVLAAGLLANLFYLENRVAAPLVIALRGVLLAERWGAWGHAARMWGGLQMGLGGLGNHRLAGWMGRRGAVVGARAGDDPSRGGGLVGAAFYLAGMGRWEEAEAVAADGLAACRAAADPRGVDEATWASANAAAVSGRLDVALVRYRALEGGAAVRGDSQLQAVALHAIAWLSLLRDDPAEARRALAAALPLTPATDADVLAMLRAGIASAEGRWRDAWTSAQEAASRVGAPPFPRNTQVIVATVAAEVLTRLQRDAPPSLAPEREAVRAAVRTLLRRLRGQVRVTPWIEPTVLRLEARVRPERVRRALLARALAAAHRLGNAEEAARIAAER